MTKSGRVLDGSQTGRLKSLEVQVVEINRNHQVASKLSQLVPDMMMNAGGDVAERPAVDGFLSIKPGFLSSQAAATYLQLHKSNYL